MLKRLFSVVACLCAVAIVFSASVTASAEIVKKGKIKIDTVSAVTGDTVIVAFKIEDNPGIMAITISITYNASALDYSKFYKGDVLKDYTIARHPDRNLIRFVNCEKENKTADGTLFSIAFRVKENAEAELHKINIEYSQGDFCNWNLDKIMPEIVPGGVDVAFNGNNCSHKNYSDWVTAAEPSCEEEGAKQRICKKCGHAESRATKPIGHEYSSQWTIDQPATKEQDGVMSRYCIRCEDFVDRITYTLEQAEDGEINNTIGADVPADKNIEEIFKEQYPDREPTENPPPAKEEFVEPEDDVKNVIESIVSGSEETDGKTTDILDKIEEVIPNIRKILDIIKTALVVLFTVIIL